jgi:hypothetical protein
MASIVTTGHPLSQLSQCPKWWKSQLLQLLTCSWDNGTLGTAPWFEPFTR